MTEYKFKYELGQNITVLDFGEPPQEHAATVTERWLQEVSYDFNGKPKPKGGKTVLVEHYDFDFGGETPKIRSICGF